MPNQYVNKVVKSNGETIIDLSQDTVTSSDHIMSGYIGHLADGSQVTGTGHGGGTAAISVVDTTDSHGGTVRTITALDISDTTAVASDVATGKYFYTASGVKTAGTGSGGGGSSTLVTKTITLNGTYDPDDDNADGYSEVTVNVQGGAAMSEVQNQYGSEVIITSGSAPAATAHSIYFEFEDETDATVTGYWNDSFISDAITATNPTTYGQKTVTSAQLDGVEWYSYSPSDIPLNTQLIDYSAVTNGYGIYSDGSVSETEWIGVSDYTRIDPTMTFTFIGNEWYYLAFYDMSKTFISTLYIYDVTSGTGTGTLSPSNIPSNASWVRITSLQNPDNSELSLIRTA